MSSKTSQKKRPTKHKKKPPAEPPLEPPPPPKRRRKHLTMEEWRALLEAARSQPSAREAALLMLMYELGLRASEPGFLLLNYARKLHEGELYVWRGKGSRSSWENPSEHTADALFRWIRESHPDPSKRRKEHYIFPGGRRHKGPLKGLSRWSVWRLIKDLAEEAGIPEEVAHPHALKHSRVQHLFEAADADPELTSEKVLLAAADVVGHKSAQTTLEHYSAKTAAEKRLLEKVTKKALK